MKTPYILILFISLIACSESRDSSVPEDNWTEDQKVHLYVDCKEKMLAAGEDEESTHAFCECILLKVVAKYSDGVEAMNNLTDHEIEQIEKSCTDALTPKE